MKSILRYIIVGILVLLARCIVRKYEPQIIMVTGSVGKTSTKDALAASLANQTFMRASEKGFNTEFGVPLTIIGAKNPWSNPFKWLRVFVEAFALILLPNHYPKLLVLEVGADKPGDLSKILCIATPDAVIVTRLPDVPVHVEAYASPEAVRDEEFAPAYALPAGAPLVIAVEDDYARRYASRIPVSVTTFGFGGDADVRIADVEVRYENGVAVGMQAQVSAGGEQHMLAARGALGRQQLLAPAAALALNLALKRPIKDALIGLDGYVPPPGRGRLFRGVNGSTIIDDSYNASPAAVEEALGGLKSLSAKRRIAVLGDMLELGRYSVEEHEKVGELAVTSCDMLVTVGIRSRATAAAAEKAGMPVERIHRFDTSAAAATALQGIVAEGDAVLIKGSQSIRTERIVSALLANPADSARLVRQDAEWQWH